MKRRGISLVNERIQWTRKQHARIDSAISVRKEALRNILNHDDFTTWERMAKRSTDLMFDKCKSEQLAKFKKLRKTIINVPSNHVQNRANVVNLSNRNLSKEEEQVLSLELNFAITPRALPKEKIIQEIEPALSRLPKQAGNQARVQITEVLRRAKLPKSNLNTKELKALKELRQDNSIHILKTDKGNATVILDRTDYDQKVQEMFTTLTYRKLKNDPTASTERNVTKHLLELRKNGSLSINYGKD